MESEAEDRRRRQREATRRYRARHPERAREAIRRWREEERERYLESNRASKRKYYVRNRDAIVRWQRQYWEKNKDRLRLQQRAYAREHREEARARSRAWYRANPEKVAAQVRRRRETGYDRTPARRAKAREWVDAHRQQVRETLRVSRLRRLAQGGPALTTADWRAILDLWGHRCAYCGADAALEAEHRMPLSRGGTSAKENIVPACGTCNRRKHTMTEEEFRLILMLERDPLDVPYRVDGVTNPSLSGDEQWFGCHLDHDSEPKRRRRGD